MVSEELKELLIESKKFSSKPYKELVDMVIKTNNINYETEYKDTLLICVVFSTVTGTYLIEKLLENGANINHQGYAKETPLMRAVEHNYEEKVEILLKYNPDLSLRNNSGHTAYDIACRLNYRRIAKLILEKMNNQVISSSDEENVITEEDYKQKLIRRFNNINARINK